MTGESKMNRTGQSKLERGQELMRAVGMAGEEWQANKKPAEQGTAGEHSQRILRTAQASKHNNQQLAGLAAKTTAADVVLPLAVQVSGGSAVVLAAMKAGADLPDVPTPPNAFACHCPYPLP